MQSWSIIAPYMFSLSNDQVQVTTVMLDTFRIFLILPSSETRHQYISFPTLYTSSTVAENIHRNKNSRNISKTSRFLSRGWYTGIVVTVPVVQLISINYRNWLSVLNSPFLSRINVFKNLAYVSFHFLSQNR